MKKFRDEISQYLSTDLNSDQMRKLMGDFEPAFDPYVQSGFERGIDIPRPVFAETIVRYLKDERRLLDFIAHILSEEKSNTGSGGVIKLPHKEKLFRILRTKFYVFDAEHGRFVKDQRIERTPDWGILRPGDSENFSFLSIDIVSSSSLGSEAGENRINHTLFNVKQFVRGFVEAEDGRLWSWDGDGGLAAFLGLHSCLPAVMAGRGILAYLPHFNIAANKLGNGRFLKFRLAVHYGYSHFPDDLANLNSREANVAEALQKEVAAPNEMIITREVRGRLPSAKQHLFAACNDRGDDTYSYSVGRQVEA